MVAKPNAFWFPTTWLSRTLGSMTQYFSMQRERETRIDRLRAVGALAAGLSHELATPLNTAQLRIRRLARNRGLSDDPDLSVARDALERCGEVLRQMAGAPLRPEGLSLQATDLDELVREVCSGFSGSDERGGRNERRTTGAEPGARLPDGSRRGRDPCDGTGREGA